MFLLIALYSIINCSNTVIHMNYMQKYSSQLTENTVIASYQDEVVNTLIYREARRQNT